MNLEVMGQATDFDADVFSSGVRTASSEASASQSFVLTPSNIQVNLGVDYQFSGNATLQEGTADAYSQYMLTFDLNSPSLVHLTGSLNEETLFSGPIGPFGSFQGEILLTGPGAPFQAILPYTNDIMQIDTSFALGPGVYTLDAVSELDVDQHYFIDSISGLDVSLNADFTAIPEPKLMSPVLALLTLAGIYFLRKHPQSCLRR